MKKPKHSLFIATKLFQKGATCQDVADVLGVSRQWAHELRKQTTIPTRSEIRDAEMMELYEDGLNDRQIATELRMKYQAVVAWRNKKSLSSNIYIERKNRRLSLYLEGLSDVQIAEKEGVNTAAIQHWRKRQGLSAIFLPFSGNHVSVGPYYPELQRECLRIETYETQGANIVL